MKTRTYLAELLGTFLFMMLGYASVTGIPNASSPAPNLLVVPFAFGLGLLAAIFSFGGGLRAGPQSRRDGRDGT